MMEFFMPMIPPTITQQEHKMTVNRKSGRIVVYDPPELKAARSKLTDALAKHKPAEPLSGPLELVETWCFPAGEDHSDGELRISKPDTDNLSKMLKDCMTRTGFWQDDAQVCREIVEKFWAKIPGIFIRVREL